LLLANRIDVRGKDNLVNLSCVIQLIEEVLKLDNKANENTSEVV
jgi:hypothetical protein